MLKKTNLFAAQNFSASLAPFTFGNLGIEGGIAAVSNLIVIVAKRTTHAWVPFYCCKWHHTKLVAQESTGASFWCQALYTVVYFTTVMARAHLVWGDIKKRVTPKLVWCILPYLLFGIVGSIVAILPTIPNCQMWTGHKEKLLWPPSRGFSTEWSPSQKLSWLTWR